MTKKHALALALLTTLFWSGSYIVNKIAFAQGIGPMTLSGFRYTLAGLTLSVTLKRNGKCRPLPVKYMLLQGVICYGLGQGCQCIGQSYLEPTVASLLLNAGMVLFLLAFDLLILKENPGTGVVWKVLLLVAGAVCYYRPWQSKLNQLPAEGVVFMVLAAFGSAMNLFFNRYMLTVKHIERRSLTLRPMLCGGMLMLAFGLSTETLPKWNLTLISCVAYLAFISGALGFSLWVISQQNLTAVQSGSINNGMLIEIAVLDMIFFAKHLTILQWIGILTVFTAITLLQLRGKKACE